MWGRRRKLRKAVRAAYVHDHAIAEELARRAAESGDVRGMTVYGIGLGDAGRTQEAVWWLQRAAIAGERLAPLALATLFVEHGDVVRAGHWLRRAEATQTPLDVRMSLFKVWARSTIPFDRPPRPPGAPTTRTELGRAAERGGGRTLAEWNDIHYTMLRKGHGPNVLLMLAPELSAKANAWFAFTGRDPAKTAAPSSPPAPDPRPREAEEWYAEGYRYAAQGDHVRATHHYRRAAEAGYGDAWLNLGVSLRHLGEHDEAERCYHKAIECGQLSDGWNNLGNLMRQRDRMDEAENCWRRAAAAGSPAARASLGVCHFQRGELDEAEALFRQSAAAGDLSGMINLATLLKRSGHLAEAGQWLRRAAMAQPPASPPAPADRPAAGPDRDAVTRWLSGTAGAAGTSETGDTAGDGPRRPDEDG
jgi:TPR repeat protein